MANANETKQEKKTSDEDVAHAYADLQHAKAMVGNWEHLVKVHKDAYESHERELAKAKAEVERLGAIFKKTAASSMGV